MTSKLCRLVIATLALTPALALAVPPAIGFSARIADNGRPVDGTHGFTFKIWNCPEVNGTDCIADDPGTPSANVLWRQASTVYVTQGVLATVLDGNGDNPFPAGIFDGSYRWLEVSMDGTAFSPKMVITSVPYALDAAYADAAGYATTASQASTAYNVACSGCVNDVDVSSGISASKISGALSNATIPWANVSSKPTGIANATTGEIKCVLGTATTQAIPAGTTSGSVYASCPSGYNWVAGVNGFSGSPDCSFITGFAPLYTNGSSQGWMSFKNNCGSQVTATVWVSCCKIN